MVHAHARRPLDLPRRPAGEQPGAVAGDGLQLSAARAAGEGQPPFAARLLLARAGPDFALPVPDPDRHRRVADVLLRAQHREGVRHHEGFAVCRLRRPGHPQHAPLGGAPDGAVRAAAHVPRVLHRRLQTPARVQLGDRRRAVSADPGAELHRLSAALGPARVLGDHRRHEHRRLRAGHRTQVEISDARRKRGRAGGADAILRAACDRAAGGGAVDGGRPSLARAQGRRAVASRRTGRHRPAGRTQAIADEQDLRPDGTRARHDAAGRQEPGGRGVFLAAPGFPRAAAVPAGDGGGAVPGDFLERAAGGTRQPDSSAESRESAVVFPRPAGTGQLLGVLGRRGGARVCS